MILWGYLFGIAYAMLCLAASLVLYKLGMPKKYTRKFVHILVGFEWVILYHFLGASVHFLAVCVFFLILLFVAYRKNLMPMISSDGENAPGTVYYAVAMTGVAVVGCFVPEVMVPFGIGIMCTSIGDGLAGVFGQLIQKYNPKVYGNKSLFGCLFNFVASTASALVFSAVFSLGIEWWQAACIGVLSVELELFTGFGLDNITITWGVTALTCGFLYYGGINSYLAPILLSLPVIAFALSRKALTGWGVVTAILMDIVISLALGNLGFTILISFFVGSLIVDKAKKRLKKKGRVEETAKGEHRDTVQVIANGFIPSVCAFCFALSHGHPAFVLAFVAALAEAFADTAASGIGAFSRHTYDVFKLRKCDNGISGGVSGLGTLAALLGSFAISGIALSFGSRVFDLKYFFIAAVCAFAGVMFDSLLGSLLQVKYRCILCSKITEKRSHCDLPTEQVGGVYFIDNDLVNFASGFFTAALALILGVLI